MEEVKIGWATGGRWRSRARDQLRRLFNARISYRWRDRTNGPQEHRDYIGRSALLVHYRSVFDVARDFMQDETFGGQDKVLTKYLKPDLVVIDDMGMKQLPNKSGEFLFEIIIRRYELKSTMMTSNRPVQDWGKLIGDVLKTARAGT
jgi:DNA replication protein DnaC